MFSRPRHRICPASAEGPHLTPEEWVLILDALSAYQHNQAYLPLYEKLLAELHAVPVRSQKGFTGICKHRAFPASSN